MAVAQETSQNTHSIAKGWGAWRMNNAHCLRLDGAIRMAPR